MFKFELWNPPSLQNTKAFTNVIRATKLVNETKIME